jgi:hypothetical protein
MKTLIITFSVAFALLAGYFGFRYFTRKDLGFTPGRKYVKNLAENVRYKLTAAREAGPTPETATEQAASR